MQRNDKTNFPSKLRIRDWRKSKRGEAQKIKIKRLANCSSGSRLELFVIKWDDLPPWEPENWTTQAVPAAKKLMTHLLSAAAQPPSPKTFWSVPEHKEDNYSAQRFENTFQRDLSRFKRCGSSGEAAFIAVDLQTLGKKTQNFENKYSKICIGIFRSESSKK